MKKTLIVLAYGLLAQAAAFDECLDLGWNNPGMVLEKGEESFSMRTFGIIGLTLKGVSSNKPHGLWASLAAKDCQDRTCDLSRIAPAV